TGAARNVPLGGRGARAVGGTIGDESEGCTEPLPTTVRVTTLGEAAVNEAEGAATAVSDGADTLLDWVSTEVGERSEQAVSATTAAHASVTVAGRIADRGRGADGRGGTGAWWRAAA